MASLATLPDPIAELIDACGTDAVLLDHDHRSFMAHDVHAHGAVPLAVVRPVDRKGAAAAVGIATSHGLAVFPRGGGMSYTEAYAPTTTGSILIDTGALDRIVEIDARGLWATVEAGVTWGRLDAALAPHGLRARFWGPFSGHGATVGGSMSNGSVTFGSGAAGSSGANVLGFEVALADGRVVRTGMDAQDGHAPFFDHYGPNLTGVFANDCGALGVKLAVTLPLVPRAAVVDGLSFVFPDFATLANAMERVARASVVSEALAMDPVVTAQFSGPPDLGGDLQMLRRIARGRGGLRRAARAMTGGRAFLSRPGFHTHFIVEGRDARDLRGKLEVVRNCAQAGAEIPNTVPSAIRAIPFAPLPLTDPRGRLILPIHGIVPFAQADPLHGAITAITAHHADAALAVGVTIATSFFTVGMNALLYEPIFYWEDALSPYQAAKAATETRYLDNPGARALIEVVRGEMIEAMHGHGAAHLQIGRRYPYARDRDLTLLRAVKQAADPHGLLNPGVLGL